MCECQALLDVEYVFDVRGNPPPELLRLVRLMFRAELNQDEPQQVFADEQPNELPAATALLLHAVKLQAQRCTSSLQLATSNSSSCISADEPASLKRYSRAMIAATLMSSLLEIWSRAEERLRASLHGLRQEHATRARAVPQSNAGMVRKRVRP